MTNFYLAYHEQDDRALQEAVAAMFLETCPALSWTASHCEAPLKKRKRLKIGICSAFMRDHTLGKQTLGVIKTLSRKRFEVFLFRLPGAEDEQSKAIDAAADKVVPTPMNLATAHDVIAGEKPDILFYPDIGTDPFTYFLSFARLAPVQMPSWGHPDTT
jgi:protein O-GlcNAc transferase